MTYILYNPFANKGKGLAGTEQVMAAYAEEAPEVIDLTKIDAKAFLGGLAAADRVILCGGDGTINRLINHLGGECPDVPIYLWRFGTGNDFLHDVAADADIQTVRLNDYIRNLPSVEAGGERIWFVNGCSGGVDALVCEKMNRDKKSNYVTTAIRSFFRDFKTTTARITVDGEAREYDRVWMAGAMNGRYQGGGMRFAPDQDRQSDRLCSYVWHGTNPVGTLLHFPSIIKGSHGKYTKYFEMRFGKEVTVEFGDPQALQFDGETITGVTKFTIRK